MGHPDNIVDIVNSKIDMLLIGIQSGEAFAKEATIDILKMLFNLLAHYPKVCRTLSTLEPFPPPIYQSIPSTSHADPRSRFRTMLPPSRKMQQTITKFSVITGVTAWTGTSAKLYLISGCHVRELTV